MSTALDPGKAGLAGPPINPLGVPEPLAWTVLSPSCIANVEPSCEAGTDWCIPYGDAAADVDAFGLKCGLKPIAGVFGIELGPKGMNWDGWVAWFEYERGPK